MSDPIEHKIDNGKYLMKHICNNCGKEIWLEDKYPMTVSKCDASDEEIYWGEL